MDAKPIEKTKSWQILKELKLAQAREGLTNKEISERITGVSNPYDKKYQRVAALTRKLEKKGFLKRVDEKENPLGRDHPVRAITDKGKEFVNLAKRDAKIANSRIHIPKGGE